MPAHVIQFRKIKPKKHLLVDEYKLKILMLLKPQKTGLRRLLLIVYIYIPEQDVKRHLSGVRLDNRKVLRAPSPKTKHFGLFFRSIIKSSYVITLANITAFTEVLRTF